MFFVVLGVLLVALRWFEVGPVAQWGWLWVLAPFGLAVVWWQVSDAMGLTRKREMDKMDRRKEERRRKAMEAMGMDWRGNQKVRVFKDTRKREAERVEAERQAKRQQQKEAVSGFGALGKPDSRLPPQDDTRLP